MFLYFGTPKSKTFYVQVFFCSLIRQFGFTETNKETKTKRDKLKNNFFMYIIVETL